MRVRAHCSRRSRADAAFVSANQRTTRLRARRLHWSREAAFSAPRYIVDAVREVSAAAETKFDTGRVSTLHNADGSVTVSLPITVDGAAGTWSRTFGDLSFAARDFGRFRAALRRVALSECVRALCDDAGNQSLFVVRERVRARVLAHMPAV